MALNSNALVTLAKAKSFLGITNTSQDTEIERLINVASQSIERVCRRVLVNATHTEYHDGRRTNMLQPREWPVTGGASANGKPEVFLDNGDGDFPASTALDDANYWVHEMNTQIVRTDGNWPLGQRNIKIIYDAGYGVGGDSASMPSDLEDACLQYVGWMYRMNNDRRLGVDLKTKLGETVKFTQGIPDFIDELIEPYRRQEFPVSPIPVRNS
jgi:hypothetical protein